MQLVPHYFRPRAGHIAPLFAGGVRDMNSGSMDHKRPQEKDPVNSASRNPAAGRGLAARAGLALAGFACLAGLVFCLMKSPEGRAQAYLALAYQAEGEGRRDDAASAAMMAARLNPSGIEAWGMLARLLREDGQNAAAGRAENIALMLQHGPARAMAEQEPRIPAELRLGFLQQRAHAHGSGASGAAFTGPDEAP